MAASPNSEIAFTDEERAMYAELRRHLELQKQIFNMMSADLAWIERDYKSAALTVVRTSLPLVDDAGLAHAHTSPSVLCPRFAGHDAPHTCFGPQSDDRCNAQSRATLMACS
jgi:hypothetical protein